MDKFQISLAAARVNAGLTQEEVAKAEKKAADISVTRRS